MRLIAGIATFHYAVAGSFGSHTLATVVAGAAGLLLFVGLWTPIAGVVLAAVEGWVAFSTVGDPWAKILLGAIGAALAMLGPGAWSIDARLFGRKRLIREP